MFSRPSSIRFNLLVVTLLGLPAVSPLWRWAAVPCTHDGHLHYHRVAAIGAAWQEGLWFSRWLPDLAFGYGYPFFLYREPLPLYLTYFFHLAGLPLPAASNFFYILALLAGGWFAYLWLREVWGDPAGLVGAAAYMLAPYPLIDALVRGNQPESLALPLFPLLLWAGRRFMVGGGRGHFLVATLGLAGLALSHNISLFIFAPLFALYLGLVGWLHRPEGWLWRLVAITGLAAGLAAFYVGPAVLEMDQVTLNQSVTTRNNDFRFNFASLAEILAPPRPEDPTLLNPPLPFRLGWVASGLAVIGLGRLWGGRRQLSREQKALTLFMVGWGVVFLFMALAVSRPVWEKLPLIDFVQFPWRFVGRVGLPTAWLAGLAVYDLRWTIGKWRFGPVASGLALIGLSLEAIPNLYPAYCPEEGYPTILTVHQYEHETGLVGVDPEGSYFPKSVEQRPAGSALEADYQAGRLPQRFDLSRLPAGASLLEAHYTPNQATIQIESPAGFTARYLTFAFPGWEATVDGQTVPITPSQSEGLITFAVPAGTHTLEIGWHLTPLRATLSTISLGSLLALLGVVWRLKGGQPLPTHGPISHSFGYLLLAILLLGVKFGSDRLESPLRYPAGPTIQHASDLVAGELQLAGYNLSQESVPAGQTITVDLAWQAMAAPAGQYQSNLWLADSNGLIWSDTNTQRPRLYEDMPPMLSWQTGQWAWDSREIAMLSGTPPGQYDLVLTFFRLDNLQPLTLRGQNGLVYGPTAIIGQVVVTRPDTPPIFQPQFEQEQQLNGLYLLGYNQDRAEAAPGDPLLLTLFWQKVAEGSPENYPLELRDGSGRVAQSWTIPPARADYPPQNWLVGERVRGQQLLRLAATLSSGRYQLWLAGRPLGQLMVQAPVRLFTAPAGITPLATTFGDQIKLVGYTLVEQTNTLSITLVWQAQQEMTISYRVFVHLVDPAGQIMSQADGEPVNWSRPTTGWMIGEYLVDSYQLSRPEGDNLKLQLGLYDPDTEQRLTPAGNNFVVIPLP